MSLKSSKNVETNVYELAITVDAEQFEAAVQKAYLKQRKKITVQGFRKGKAPRALIEKVYGQGVFYEDAFDELYPEVVSAAIDEAKLDIVASPYDVNVEKIGKEGVEFTLKVVVKPEVKLGKYKGLKAEKKEVKVTAEDVNAEIERLREQNARTVTVEDRAVKKGDIAVIDFEGFRDGKAFEGGKGENHELEIGSNSFIPGFEDQIKGHKTGDEFEIMVTFPGDYASQELAGQEAMFKIKLHEIKKKELPALDDDFAMDVSEFDTLAELKKDIKATIKKRREENVDIDFTNALLDMVAEGIKAEIPEQMVDRQIDSDIDDFGYRLQMQGLSLDMYLKYTGMDNAALRESFKEKALKEVKLNLALDEIVKKEKIEATEEAVEAEYKKLAETYNMDVDQIKKALPAENITGDIVRATAIDLIKENAVAGKPAAEKPAEKKTAAKEEKPAEKKAPAKKTAAKKETAEKKTAEKKPAAKKTAEKKPAEKKTAEKKPAAKKAPAKKPAAKKTEEKK